MEGLHSLPRRSGELVFHDDWERRAFAIAVALCEQGHYDWQVFQRQLIAEIDATGDTPGNPRPGGPGYYEHWLNCLEKVLVECGLTAPADESSKASD